MPDDLSMASHSGGRPRKPVSVEKSTWMLCCTLNGSLTHSNDEAFSMARIQSSISASLLAWM